MNALQESTPQRSRVGRIKGDVACSSRRVIGGSTACSTEPRGPYVDETATLRAMTARYCDESLVPTVMVVEQVLALQGGPICWPA